MEKLIDMQAKFTEIRHKDTYRMDSIINFLQIKYPQIVFVGSIDKENYKFVIYTETSIPEDIRYNIYHDLKLTGLRFVDNRNYVYN